MTDQDLDPNISRTREELTWILVNFSVEDSQTWADYLFGTDHKIVLKLFDLIRIEDLSSFVKVSSNVDVIENVIWFLKNVVTETEQITVSG